MTETAIQAQFLTNRFGDRVLYEINRDAFDHVGSAAVFQRHFGDSLWREDALHIFAGSDSGLLPKYVLQHGIPNGSRFIFIEPDEILASLREGLPELFEALDDEPSVRLTNPQDWKELKQDFSFQDYAYLERLYDMRSIGASDAFLAEYRTLYWEIHQEIESYCWQVNMRLGSQVFVQRQIENLADNRVPAIELKDRFRGLTAVLLGGGPSLDEVLPWLSENRGKVAVIAVSRICRRLYEANITPDFVVSIDPHDVSFDVSKDLMRFDSGTTLLINSYHVSPPLLSQWHGRSAHLGARYPWTTSLNKDNLPNQGPTVTNTAFAMGVEMGFSRLILGGVDLCYSREGFTHASGSNEHQAGPMLGNVGPQVETNGGWMADTRHSFATAVDIMGNQAKVAEEHDCQVINPAAGAAKIPNVDHIPLTQLEPCAPGQSISEIIDQCLPATDRASRMAQYKAVGRELSRVNGRLRQVQQLTDEALRCNDGLFGRNGLKADFKYKKKMDKIEKRLDREFKELAPLLKTFGSRRFLRLLRPDRDREWTDEEIERWGRAYYEAYQESADTLLGMVETAQAELEIREMEEAETPDLVALTQAWNERQRPGRAKVWRQRHAALHGSLSTEQRALLAELEHGFEAILDRTDTVQAQWCQDNYTLTPVRSKALVLFQQQDRVELRRLSEELGKQSSAEAEELQALTLGYLYELDGQLDQALDVYSLLVDRAVASFDSPDQANRPHNPRLEDALKRMSFVTLSQQDGDNALLIMQSLATLAPVYEPEYAELLRLTGDHQAAIDVYTDYLSRVPDDLSSMLKLGKLYKGMGASESANWAFRYVLERSPENPAARALLNELTSPATLQ